MSAKERSIAQRNIAYPATDNFVKIGNLAYPITHSFVVGERWVEDPDAPAILECYNFVYVPPLVPAPQTFYTSGNFSATMKYAFCNYPTIEVGGHTHMGPFTLQWLQEVDEWGASLPGFDVVSYGIGYYNVNPGFPYQVHGAIPPIKTIDTLTWQSPRIGSIFRQNPVHNPDMIHAGINWAASSPESNNDWRWPHPLSGTPLWQQWGTDFVMWVYDWEWFLEGEHLRFDPVSSHLRFQHMNIPFIRDISDELFQPGTRGMRVISRKYWDAPWERYPHLQ